MSTAEPTVRCESCGDEHPESDMEFKDVPGATLAFCPGCRGPSNREVF